MNKTGLSTIRLVFAATGLMVAIFVAVALFQKQSGVDVSGKWQLATIDGIKAPGNASVADEGFDIHENGSFDWPSFQVSGSWKLEGSNLVLHPEKYDGKTQAEFREVTQAKYPSDPAMQKIADKVFETLKLAISDGGTSLSISLGGSAQTYTKRIAQPPGA